MKDKSMGQETNQAKTKTVSMILEPVKQAKHAAVK